VGLGFLWALAHAHLSLEPPFPETLQGRDVVIEGKVASLPVSGGGGVRFDFIVDSLRVEGKRHASPGRVRLSWYETDTPISAGDHWRLGVRLKAVHGYMNPGGFDYEGWLFRKGIRVRGYVTRHGEKRRIDASGPMFDLQMLRQRIRNEIDISITNTTASGLLKALVIGDRSGLTDEDWELFRYTGTNHLIAISGLHIGIISGLAFLLGIRIWKVIPRLPLLVPAPRAAAVASILAGGLYAGLAGFSIPTQRALLMLVIFMGSHLLARTSRPSRSFALALLSVTLVEPTSVLSPGFWLSFLAVGIILICLSGKTGKAGVLRSWGSLQGLIALGMAPALLIWQLQFPLVAPVVNFLAIPLFSFVIIPVCLVGTGLLLISPSWGAPVLSVAAWLLENGMGLLSLAADMKLFASVSPGISPLLWPFIGMGSLLLLSPPGVPGRWLGLPLLLPLVYHTPPVPQKGEVWMHMLDVGQGLAVVVRTHRHTLVYDTGPRYSPTFDAGAAVLIPFLEDQGIERIDTVVLSNGDDDHQGGVVSLASRFLIPRILGGEPDRVVGQNAEQCLAGMEWSWDGVLFRILHPDGLSKWSGNNASCVLSIQSPGGGILIPGDIEAAAEKRLIQQSREHLATDLLVIPHHGSKTSSGIQFANAAKPGFALVSAGYLNRYRFPREEVVARWKNQGARVMTTAEHGAISFQLHPEEGIQGPVSHRLQRGRYWNHRIREKND
jgi:competence protein ComEC